MARNITDIYDSIMDYKKSRSELNKLNSTSQAAIYKLWAYITAAAIFTHELLWDIFREEINVTLEARINGTNEWYVGKALEYQDGNELKILSDGTRLGYSPIIEGNKIVSRCAYFEDKVNFKGRLNLKMAKGSPSNLSKLAAEELGRITNYFEKIKFAGTNINLISIKADEIELTDITVYHDGVRTNDDIRVDIEAAMNNFLTNLSFDGIFYIEAFRDSLQEVENVVDINILELKRVSYINGEEEVDKVVSTIVRRVTLDAGYAGISSFTPLKIEIEI